MGPEHLGRKEGKNINFLRNINFLKLSGKET